jgi:hypothetical protein
MLWLFIAFVVVMSMLDSGSRILSGIAAAAVLVWLFS